MGRESAIVWTCTGCDFREIVAYNGGGPEPLPKGWLAILMDGQSEHYHSLDCLMWAKNPRKG